MMVYKKNLFIGLIIFSICCAWTSIYFLKKYNDSPPLVSATETENSKKRIEALEKEIEALKLEKTNSALIPEEKSEVQAEITPKENTPPQSPALKTPIESGTPLEVSTSGPILTARPEIFDLGNISKKTGIATAKFELKNTGNSDLTLNYAFTSCGCTVAPIKEEKILKPGETYPLEVTYDPNFYGPNYELGAIEKTITIISNYSAAPFYKIKLKANVLP